jgi:excisionase family DNA binding protein
VNARYARKRSKGVRKMKDYFSVTELADHFNVNPKTIYRRLWAKGIPAYKVGRIWRIAKKDIKWLRC